VTTGEGIVTIGIEFPDQKQAYRLVNTCRRERLDAAARRGRYPRLGGDKHLENPAADQETKALAAALSQLEAARVEARLVWAGGQSDPVGRAKTRAAAEPEFNETSHADCPLQSKASRDSRSGRVPSPAGQRATDKSSRSSGRLAANNPHSWNRAELEPMRQESPQVTASKRDVASLDGGI